MNQRKYIKFTGAYGKLKAMGFAFQRLYAANYMQWCNGDTRVWKKGANVTHDRLTNFDGAFFEAYIAARDALPWHTPSAQTQQLLGKRPSMLRVIKNHADHTVSFDYSLYQQQTQASFDDPAIPMPIECVAMTREDLAPLDQLIDLGWVELGLDFLQEI